MAWIGWLLAVVAIGAAAWFARRVAAEQAVANELLVAKIAAENETEALRNRQTQATGTTLLGDAGSPLGDIALHLRGSLESVRDDLEEADTQFGDYRERVKQFDAAVQYCLQPVELIFGADKATLDQLIQHVEGARRKLFEARAAVERHPLHKGAIPLTATLDRARALADYAQGLSSFGTAQGDEPADVNACMDDALRVLAPRFGERIGVGRNYTEIPKIQAPAAEVRQLFLHLLDHAARTIAAQGTLTATTRRGTGKTVEVSIAETGSGSGDEVLGADANALFATDEATLGLDFAQQLVEELGGTIAVRTKRGQGSTWTLTLPLGAPQAVAATAEVAR